MTALPFDRPEGPSEKSRGRKPPEAEPKDVLSPSGAPDPLLSSPSPLRG